MRRARFVEERSPEWAELGDLLDRAKGRPERLGPDGVRRLGALYRAAAADLGLARRAFPTDPVSAQLEGLVLRGRQAVYGREPRRASLWHFLTTGYWQRVRERPGFLALAAALLLGPVVLGWIWGLNDPAAAYGLVPEQFRNRGGEPIAGSLSLSDEAGFAGEIFTNNIRVTFLAVAAGITLGVGTAALAVYNGLLVGALGGISAFDGEAERFVTLVIPHGIIELSLIVVAVTAGLRIGWAIVEPGHRTRVQSLGAKARPAMELVLGTMPWLVLAGLVEGFFTGSGPTLVPSVILGVALGVVYWSLVLWRGRPSEAGSGLLAQVGGDAGGGEAGRGRLDGAGA